MEVKILVTLLAALVASTFAEQVKFNGYKVFRITPRNEAEVKLVKDLENLGLNFWAGPNPPNRNSDVMVPPHMMGFIDSARAMGLDIKEYISDVQSVIDETSSNVITKRAPGAAFDFGAYHSFDDIVAHLKEQATAHPDSVSIFSIGRSYEGRDLVVLKISKPSDTPKRAVWVDANIHAREWITSAATLYIIDQILNGDNETYKKWTDDYDWYFLTVHNPDGFEFSRTNNRMWRKTRSSTSSVLCKGADPNRNWGFEWRTGGSSSSPCTDTFAGATAFSEPETNSTAEFINTIAKDLDMFISMHSYSQLLLIPYGLDHVDFPGHEPHMELGKRVVAAIRQKFNTRFTPGNIVDLLYVASGGSMDWVQGVHHVPVTFTFELRDTGNYGFLLPANQIIPSGQELLDGFEVLIDALRQGVNSKK